MIKKLVTLSLILLLSSTLITAYDLNNEEVFEKFIDYIKEVYLTNADDSRYGLPHHFKLGGELISARMLGYAHGNLTQYAPRGSENHKIALKLEEKIKNAMFSQLDHEGQKHRLSRARIEKMKDSAWREFQHAQLGFHDDSMARRTSVKVKNAPNFFDTLKATPPDPPIPPTPPDPPTPPTPPSPPTPPISTMWDAVEGTYKVIGQSWENDPSYGSSVILKGSMARVETEFKLFYRSDVTWNYKGTAQFVGQKHGSRIYKLSGTTYPVQYTYNKHGLEVMIGLGDDNHWRATSINIGGNLFNLQQKQITGRKKVVKILTIKNSTDREISVFLQGVAGRPDKRFGSVDANSEKSFTGIPESGRWYFSIVRTTQSHIKPHSFTLYVKEDQFVYFHEAKPEHFRQN
jgi:hypothetical protein